MRHSKFLALAVLAVLAVAPTSAQAQLTWNWSFGTNAGTFLTDGTAPGNVAAPGTYNLTDFTVSASGQGATVGSLSGGQYAPGSFSTNLPYSFAWSGSAVSSWSHSGGNSFDWWAFRDQSTGGIFLFGYQTGNINDPGQAEYYSSQSYPVTVSLEASVVATPEPATVTLLGMGLLAIGLGRRKRKAA